MLTILIIFLVGISIGIIGGLLPGIGIGMVIISAYPLLQGLSIYEIFFFYLVVDSTIQYYGSISAIVFGVVGETTSVPAVENGHALFRLGLGNDILTATATSSFIGALLGLTVFWLCSEYSFIIMSMLTGKAKIAILILVIVVLACVSTNKILSILLIAAGLTVGSAGSDIITWARLLFPQYSIFSGGIPFAPLLVGFIVLPTLAFYIKNPPNADQTVRLIPSTAAERIRCLFKLDHFFSTLRGSIIGCICGAIPGVSYSISSNLAESAEKLLNKNGTDVKSLTKNVLSAEAANNSGAIVVLIPLLLFMIPILPSEAIVLGLAESKGFVYSVGSKFISENVSLMILTILGINLVNWILSGYCYQYVSGIYTYLGQRVYLATMILCIAIVMIAGYLDNELLLTAYVLAAASAVGFLIKDITVKMPFVFSFFMAGELLPELYRQYLIYFS